LSRHRLRLPGIIRRHRRAAADRQAPRQVSPPA